MSIQKHIGWITKLNRHLMIMLGIAFIYLIVNFGLLQIFQNEIMQKDYTLACKLYFQDIQMIHIAENLVLNEVSYESYSFARDNIVYAIISFFVVVGLIEFDWFFQLKKDNVKYSFKDTIIAVFLSSAIVLLIAYNSYQGFKNVAEFKKDRVDIAKTLIMESNNESVKDRDITQCLFQKLSFTKSKQRTIDEL